jgi:hypothetical protein
MRITFYHCRQFYFAPINPLSAPFSLSISLFLSFSFPTDFFLTSSSVNAFPTISHTLFSLSLPLSSSCYRKRARLAPAGTAADPIATEAYRTRTERLVRLERTRECDDERTYNPAEFPLGASERASERASVIVNSSPPRNLLSSPSRYTDRVRCVLPPYLSFSLSSPLLHRENRVGFLNRGPVPWLLARPLAGFE